MYDIDFYMKSAPIRKKLDAGDYIPKEEVFNAFESYRSKDPVIYNIETTNACNMRCKMCPRTTKMDRDITFLDHNFIEKIVSQIKPHSKELWHEWEKFCTSTYGIKPEDEASENHFFLYVIPKVIQLHGYGDPLLDQNLGNVVKILSNNGFESYFSCNPANIDIEKTEEMMANGLNYLKYSFESTDDLKFKDIRGNAANFTEAYHKTLEVLSINEKNGYNTKIIITMINVGHDEVQQEEFRSLTKVFEDKDVYLYLKSEDQQWYRKDESLKEYLEDRGRDVPDQKEEFYGTNAIHWLEFCKHPWMSMSVKSDGEIHMCMEDYNNEVFLGDAGKSTLSNIWNGDLYNKFRRDHFELTPCIKCNEECDMPKIGQYFNEGLKITPPQIKESALG